MKWKKLAVFFVALMVAGGCGTSSSDSESVGKSGNQAAAASTSEWDPNTWKAKIKISPHYHTEEEKLAFRTQWLKRHAEFLEIETPPDIPLVEWQESLELMDNKNAECFRERGFSAHAIPRGGVIFNPTIPESQYEAYKIAAYECQAMYFPNPEFLTDWSEDQLRVIWDYWDEYYIPCLAAHGLTVDTSERPARETYVATFYTDAEHRWFPSNDGALLTQIPPDVWKTCPKTPPASQFYGLE
ncbi:hypothetical protein ACXITP_01760 [Actinotignum sanguinis]|uniref:Uncharacterized protein n=2 Tax=Actinomycetaceae TaxID=2049 RepID=A0ABZ0RDP6_9ACTO|nr:hypothetical protein [Actinotignum sanguinis]WPJ89069.1 hypothetical protein R0V15_00265 [Schaalia turicensis]MDE1553694.1 hypothetical protein [Actinotignum sanguinis]MDE1564666.1 hypothetical protein [Actinotignum sanguinis]MDE1576701.1 hypothetical protein [Actinotignum sanguinis]MDE1642603.1 hypothetical protein [Actinotignum sanguinis]